MISGIVKEYFPQDGIWDEGNLPDPSPPLRFTGSRRFVLRFIPSSVPTLGEATPPQAGKLLPTKLERIKIIFRVSRLFQNQPIYLCPFNSSYTRAVFFRFSAIAPDAR